MTPRILAAALAVALLGTTMPATAQQQQSQSYKFIEAIRSAKGDEVERMLNVPGTVVINTRDSSTGDGALHIVVRRGDATYLKYLLFRGADPDLKGSKGNTPMLLAAEIGRGDLIEALLAYKANVNLANSSGETPLIRAVQRRDLALMRMLLAAGADPDQTDVISGQSARDYAHADARTPALARLIDATPRKVRRAVSGPKL